MMRKILTGVCAMALACGAQGAWIVDPGVAAPDWAGVRARVAKTANRHVYFRGAFETREPLRAATLSFAADDRASVSLDGAFLTEGPEVGVPQAQPVERIDLTARLARPGRHVLAADVYYLGRVSRALSSGDGRFGFSATFTLVSTNGLVRTIETGSDWRCFISTARTSARRTIGYDTQFNEDTDLRLDPLGWRTLAFDDSAWSAAVPVTVTDYAFIPAEGRPLAYAFRTPVAAARPAPDVWFWDMGEEMTGTPVVTLAGGTNGQHVVLKQAEELLPDGTLRYKTRANCDYSDTFTLRGGEDELAYADYRAFRYVALEGWRGTPPVLKVRSRQYPFEASRTAFVSDDARFDAIWEMCVRGLAVGTQDRYMDCPSREKGQYTGDAWMTAVARWYVTADATIWRKAILDFARSQSAEDPWLLCVAPGAFKQRLAEWSMLWMALLADYADATGDTLLARQLVADGTVDRFLAGFRSLENAQGFHCDPEKKLWILVDWPKNQRCGYDYEATIGGGAVNTWANAFLYGMFRNGVKVYRAAGEKARADALAARADEFRTRFNAAFLDPVTGFYHDGLHADGTLSPRCSHQAGVGALYWGLVPPEAEARVVAKIARERTAGSLFTGFYAIAALADHGRADLAWELMAGEDAHSWATMIKEGATTPFEAWSRDDKWNTSLCHPFAAVPVTLFAKHLLGLRWDPVACKPVFSPRSEVRLPAFSFKFPLPTGGTATLAHRASGAYDLK